MLYGRVKRDGGRDIPRIGIAQPTCRLRQQHKLVLGGGR